MTIFGFPYLKKIGDFSGATAGNWPLFDCRRVRIFIVLANGASEKLSLSRVLRSACFSALGR